MTWSLIKEIGSDESTLTDVADEGRLCFPTYAARAEDGTYLIAEEIGIEKQVPFRFECRTIRVDAAGKTAFDTMDHGIGDGFGCLLDEGWMAILRRTKWEILVLTPQGKITKRLNLARLSKRMPRFVSWTHRRTFLVVFFNRSFDVDVIEIDEHGRLLWYLPPNAADIGIVGNAQLLSCNTILIADPFRHVAIEMDREGNVVWQYGDAENPSADSSRLSSPNCAMEVADGRRVVADTRNHRILVIEKNRSAQQLKLHDDNSWDPTFVNQLANGNFLICDTGNARVIEVDDQGRTVWCYGGESTGKRLLSYPRSVDVIGPQRYLVADTAHDRVVEIVDGRLNKKPFHGEPELFWPRCVRMLPSGSLLIADSRNGRIVEVSPEGCILNQLSTFCAKDGQSFHDPHDVRMLRNGHLLVTDSTRDVVVEVDWDGHVHSVIGENDNVDLDDPHSAQQLDDGSVLISDTGHHRILLVDANGRCVKEYRDVRNNTCCFRLHQPRYVEVSEDGTMVIADTGNNRILAATRTGEFLWEFSHVPNSSRPFLNQPRWVRAVNRNEAVICDHFHHRILHVKRVGDSEMGS